MPPTEFDVILMLPYPFTDHPSFPEALLKRSLETAGFSVGVIETPFWQKKESFAALGRPRLFFAIIAGPVDSVVLNYTSARKRRMEDQYQRSGKAFFPDTPDSIKYRIRPDRTLMVFCARLKEVFKDVPIVIGGVEGALRRFAHYDFQENKIRRSILLDTRADIVVNGMGEKQIVRIAAQYRQGRMCDAPAIAGTTRVCAPASLPADAAVLPAYEEISAQPALLLQAQLLLERAQATGKRVAQRHANRYVLDELPMSYTPDDLATYYGWPYSRDHAQAGPDAPALTMNRFSITSHRGCAGACAFCSISCLEGSAIVSRSLSSIQAEIAAMNRHRLWRGVVSDMGGASAEMYGTDCYTPGCQRSSCLYPAQCPQFQPGGPYLQLLRAARRSPGVRQVLIGSGLRYDLLLANRELLEEIMTHHCGRFLRVAPEHSARQVLDLMRKPAFEVFADFVALFQAINRTLKRKIELAPYLIVGHPGEEPADVEQMKRDMQRLGLNTMDAQIFTPTPGTLSTAMFVAEMGPAGQPLAVAKDVMELQRRKRLLTDMSVRD